MNEKKFDSEYFRSLWLRGQGLHKEAIEIYRNRLKENPQDNTTRWDLAVTLSQSGDLESARTESQKTVDADPANYAFRMTLTKILLEQRDWATALVHARDLTLIRGNLAAPQSYIGDAYYGMGDLVSAIEAYEQAAKLPGVSPDMILFLGQLYEEAGQPDDSIKAFKRALENFPGSWSSMFQLAKVFELRGMTSEAKAHWQMTLDRATSIRDLNRPHAELDEVIQLANAALARL